MDHDDSDSVTEAESPTSAAVARFGAVPIAVAVGGAILAIALVAVQQRTKASYIEEARGVAIAHEVIKRKGGPGGEQRRRLVLEKLAADGESLAGVDLREARLGQINLSGGVLDFAVLDRAKLRGAKLSRASLVGASLRDVDASRAVAIGADMTGADLSEANFEAAALQQVDFTRAKLSNTKLPGAKLAGAHFVRSYLVGADLQRSDLSDVQFFESDLFEANLGGAMLSGASLQSARLKQSNLSGSDLTHAVVATLTPGQLRSACLDPARTKLPKALVFDMSRYSPPARCCELFVDDFVLDGGAGCVAKSASR